MELLFSQEEIREMDRREAHREGAEERDTLYSELLRRLEPLGRVSELLAAIADKAKLAALAQEFGLEL